MNYVLLYLNYSARNYYLAGHEDITIEEDVKFTNRKAALFSSVPWYSSGLFLFAPKILMVGKPLTPYWPPSDLCWSASTAPTLTIP